MSEISYDVFTAKNQIFQRRRMQLGMLGLGFLTIRPVVGIDRVGGLLDRRTKNSFIGKPNLNNSLERYCTPILDGSLDNRIDYSNNSLFVTHWENNIKYITLSHIFSCLCLIHEIAVGTYSKGMLPHDNEIF